MTVSAHDPEQRAVSWQETSDASFPYSASVDGDRWELRVNDWPDHPSVYTLFINGRLRREIDDWPTAWTRPHRTQ